MGGALPLTVLLPLLAIAQPGARPASPYSRPPAAMLALPEQPGVEAYGEAESLARSSLVGTWHGVYFERDGQSHPEVAAGLAMKFSRGRLELMQSGRPTIVVAYNINPAKSPAGFLWKLPHTSGSAFQDGIFYLDGNRLTICLSALNRPPAWQFLTQPGDGKSLFVLERTNP